MSTTEIPTSPRCLVCDCLVTLKGATRIVEDHLDSCPGSGYIFVQNDGKDDVRRRAIRQNATLWQTINKHRAQFDENAKHWEFAIAVSYHASRIVPYETQAKIWQQVALTGDLWEAAAMVMESLTGRKNDPFIPELLTELIFRGQREWLSSVRMDLLTEAHTMGEVGAILSKVLFGCSYV